MPARYDLFGPGSDVEQGAVSWIDYLLAEQRRPLRLVEIPDLLLRHDIGVDPRRLWHFLDASDAFALTNGIVSRCATVQRPSAVLPASEGACVLMVGTFGAGKSSLIRQLIGTVHEEAPFPAVSPGKTTIARTSIEATTGPTFTATAGFLPVASVTEMLQDNLVAATRRIMERRDDREVMRALLDHTGQRFRLMQTFADHSLLMPVIAGLRRAVAAGPVGSGELLTREVEQKLRASVGLQNLTMLYLDVLMQRVNELVERDRLTRDSQGWPVTWRYDSDERGDFLRELSIVAGVGEGGAKQGALLTPLVDRLRVSGPFRVPTLAETPHLQILDTPGLGHDLVAAGTGADQDSLRELILGASSVVLVDSGKKPMYGDARAVLAEIATLDAEDKLHLAVTHMDQVRGGPVATEADAADHVWQSVAAALNASVASLGIRKAESLRSRLEDNTYFLSHLGSGLSSDDSEHEWTVGQLGQLMRRLAA